MSSSIRGSVLVLTGLSVSRLSGRALPVLCAQARNGAAGTSKPSMTQNTAKDPAADLLERTLHMSLNGRLKRAKSITVHADVTVAALMGGQFGGLHVVGQRWTTPLNLTADRVEVDVGELLLDYSALMTGQMALRNTPRGTATLSLNSQDLANFFMHPLMRQASMKAVKGLPFLFDNKNVSMGLDAAGNGWVECEGVWAADAQRYQLYLVLPPQGAGGSGPRVQVQAMQLAEPGPATIPPRPQPTTSFASAGSMDSMPAQQSISIAQASTSGASGTAAASVTPPRSGGAARGEAAVSEGLEELFSGLLLDLQGIELCTPFLSVRPRSQQPRHAQCAANSNSSRPASSPAAAAQGDNAGSSARSHSVVPQDVVLDITMQLTMRSIPPLSMSF